MNRVRDSRLPGFRWTFFGGLLLMLLIAMDGRGSLPATVDSLALILRLPLALAYVFIVPGYYLTAALFPHQRDLDGIERFGLSLGLSVAWVPLLALILDRLPWGLRLWPIVTAQLLSILLFAAVAVYRRVDLADGESYDPRRWRPAPWWRSLPLQEKRICQLSAGALLVAGLALAWVLLVPAPGEFMTEFYILGADGLGEGYPREAAAGDVLSVTLGINNKERHPMIYRLEVWAFDPWEERRQQLGQAGPFRLDVGQSVQQPLHWAMPWPGADQIVEFYLFTQGQVEPQPYRQLRLWLYVSD